jgi:hypothetical protein
MVPREVRKKKLKKVTLGTIKYWWELVSRVVKEKDVEKSRSGDH